MKFKMLEDYQAQKAVNHKAAEELNRKINQADEDYSALKATYESVLKQSVLSAKDMTKDLDDIASKIEDAKKTCQRRREERDMYYQLRPNEDIKPMHVVNAFNQEFIAEYKKAKYDDVIKALLRAKVEYSKAFQAYFDCVADFEDYRLETQQALGDSYRYKINPIHLNTRQEIERYMITQRDLSEMEMKQVPSSIQYVTEEDLK